MSQLEISVFGASGFVGNHYCHKSKFQTSKMMRETCVSDSPNIVYFVGTVDNYNIFTDPQLDIRTNLEMLIKVLEACREKWGKVTFNFISSWFVYGDGPIPFNESQACNPRGFYSITKYAAELLLRSYCETFKSDFRIIRLGNVIGPNDKKASLKKNAIQFMLQMLRENKPVSLYENGQIVRDLIHVDDVVRGIDLILESGDLNTIYNLASGVPTVVKELVEGYKEHIGSTSEITSIETPSFHRLVQVRDSILDIRKIQELGFSTEVSLDNATLDTL